MNKDYTFDMIIGYDSIKQELKQICDIMLNPSIYAKFSINLPHGLLLSGVPGIGKSLMAKCLCQESKRMTFSIYKTQSDGEFVKEIEKTFNKAAENAPSIVLLEDMDKFANEDDDHPNGEEYVAVQSCIDEIKNKNVFVIATVNDLNKLPESLKRIGRFDRQISVDRPTPKDAKQIIQHYLQQKNNVSDAINIDEISTMMYGRTCAELESVINEAGIQAGYKRKAIIEYEDFMEGFLRVTYNSSKSLEEKNPKRCLNTAYHEAGHAAISEILESNSVSLVSVSGYETETKGITLYYHDENYLDSFENIEHSVMKHLAGRISTELFTGSYDLGSDSDYESATRLIKKMIEEYDVYGTNEYHYYFYDRSMASNNNVALLMRSKMEEYSFKTRSLLFKNKQFVDKIVALLMEKETITAKDIQQIKNTL